MGVTISLYEFWGPKHSVHNILLNKYHFVKKAVLNAPLLKPFISCISIQISFWSIKLFLRTTNLATEEIEIKAPGSYTNIILYRLSYTL